MTKVRDYDSTKDIVKRLFDEAGGVSRCAALLGKKLPRVYEYCDPQSEPEIHYESIRLITEFTGAATAAQDLAALAGGVFLPIDIEDGALSQIAADKAHEHGRVISHLIVAMADGKVASDEARELLKLVDSELRALVTMRAKLAELAKKG